MSFVALVCLIQLDMKNGDEMMKKIEDFLMTVAENDVKKGIEMIEQYIIEYCEFDEEKMKDGKERLIKIVMKRRNIENQFGIIKQCIMKLPIEYLKMIEYGDDHTEKSEFNVILEYMKINKENLGKEGQKELIKNCDERRLNSDEIEEIDRMKIMNDEEMKVIYRKVLKWKEEELKEERKARKDDLKRWDHWKILIEEKERTEREEEERKKREQQCKFLNENNNKMNKKKFQHEQ